MLYKNSGLFKLKSISISVICNQRHYLMYVSVKFSYRFRYLARHIAWHRLDSNFGSFEFIYSKLNGNYITSFFLVCTQNWNDRLHCMFEKRKDLFKIPAKFSRQTLPDTCNMLNCPEPLTFSKTCWDISFPWVSCSHRLLHSNVIASKK